MAQTAIASRRKGLTWKDVARAAGVSPTTASLALNNHPRVALKTRHRIAEVAARIGFVSNHAARRLARSRADSRTVNFDQVGLVYLFATEGELDMACMVMMRGVERELSKLRANLIFVRVGEREDWEKIERLVKEGGVDGWLLVGTVTDEAVNQIKRSGLPYVIMGDHRCKQPAPSVNVDYRAVGRMAVQHLSSLGHRHIGFLGVSMQFVYQKEILEGFRAAMKEWGLSDDKRLIANASIWKDPKDKSLLKWLESASPKPTALFMPEFEWAAVVYEILQQSGMEIPKEISLLGCRLGSVIDGNRNLTCIDLPLAEVGRYSASLLHRIVSETHGAASEIRLSPSLIEERSTRPPVGPENLSPNGITANPNPAR